MIRLPTRPGVQFDDAARDRRQVNAQRATRRLEVAEDSALPFDAVRGTILYSPDRKLAIVDGRIVEAGDKCKTRASSRSDRPRCCCVTLRED